MKKLVAFCKSSIGQCILVLIGAIILEEIIRASRKPKKEYHCCCGDTTCPDEVDFEEDEEAEIQ